MATLKIIKERERKTEVEYNREFRFKDDPNAGYSFPCDENGNLFEDLNEVALENYKRCLTDDRITDLGVTKREYSYTEPAIGKCSCGRENQMVDQTNGYAAFQCECGQWYNLSGQALKPIEQWNEDY